MIGILGYFGKYHFEKLNLEIKDKADRTELSELRKELRDSRDAHERDKERMERIANERYAALQAAFNQRITDMERHMTTRLDDILKILRKP